MKSVPSPFIGLSLLSIVLSFIFHAGSANAGDFDLLIRGGSIYDGTGRDPVVADIAIRDDQIVAMGWGLGGADTVIDATGLAVAPGFINMLSWATEDLIEDGRSLSDIRQGVTLEVMGEGWSMGPVNDRLKTVALQRQSDIRYDISWRTLGGYLQHLEDKGISTNVASFVGATTLRIHEIGFEDRPPTAEELQRMQALVREAMEEGALGVGSSLIYAPAFYASTEELIALCKVAAEYGGRYISHMRSESAKLPEAIDELIRIADEAGIGAEIYHLKAAGVTNHDKLETAITRIEEARARGLDITADMYTYTAGATGLDASMPPWVQEGGYEAWAQRLADPEIRERLRQEISTPGDDWENLYAEAGDAEKLLLTSFRNPDLRKYTGMTLAAVAKDRGQSPIDTMMDLVIEDGSRVGTVYFLMNEDNVRRKITLPWMAFGSDSGSMAPEGVFLNSNPHPRGYGNFARLLGRYVRDEQLISLPEAIHRLTGFPAANLKLRGRGILKPGNYADIVVFDPAAIVDHATFANPHQLATGVRDVVVNGAIVLRDGKHTDALPGRFVRGPGFAGPVIPVPYQ
ncbi:N-acyl-D-amino-acid deacylase family protein [Congregibacter sp.]|uniref:N-acyl-D-amino-acid deacylase family protein n=1 Tax=Congregibacter sp. TaxID=2744308 RepID=UPI0039E4DC39